VILAVHTFVALLGPVVAPYSPGEIIDLEGFAAPGEVGLLGTDFIGRDLFSRVLYGARLTIGVALAGTLLGFLSGMAMGFIAAEVGGWIDNIIGRIIDLLISFPPILIALIVIVGLGSSLWVLIGTIGVIHTPRVARVSRAVAMDISAQEFVEVARARGEGLWSIISREILPNSLTPLGVEFGLRFVYSVLILSSLSFLGLGIQPPAADWGLLVRENMSGLLYGAWAALVPSAAIASLAVGINFVVDWLSARAGQEISEELLK
jgi:peptide/nickel transport system permease protein